MEFRDGILHIGGVSVLDIVERFGTPVYVYDAGVIVRQIENVKRAFAALPFRPFYAMKANGKVETGEDGRSRRILRDPRERLRLSCNGAPTRARRRSPAAPGPQAARRHHHGGLRP